MGSIRVGLIGYGFAGQILHAPLIAATDGLRLVRIASSNPDKAGRDPSQAHVDSSPQALIQAADVDLVVIATPSASHHELAREALLAGKHVVVEKPFTLTSAQADELQALAARQQRLLSVFHNRRWDGDFLTVQQQIASGVLGEIHTFCSTMDRYRPQVRERWREDDAPGSGILYDLGSHLIDQALLLFGMPHSVWADVGAQRPGSPAIDYFHLVLGYGARRAILHAGSIVAQPAPRFQVHGSRGSLVCHGVDPQEAALRQGLPPGAAGWGVDARSSWAELCLADAAMNPGAPSRIDTLAGDYLAYYRGLVRALRSEAPAPVDAQDAGRVIRLIECALRSQHEQRRIELN